MILSHLQNGSSALHAAVMSGNIQSVLLLLGANADPTLLNKVRALRVDVRWMELIVCAHKTSSCVCFAE